MRPIDDNEFDIFLDSEDAPQIAGIVDEHASTHFTDRRKWKIVADNIDGDLTITNREPTTTTKTKRSIRARRDESEDDLSPPRAPRLVLSKEEAEKNKRIPRNDDSDLSPPRKHTKKKHKKSKVSSESDSDSNTDKKKQKKKKKSRKHKSDSDLSPPRKSKNEDSDLSPPRKSRNNDSDLSPPRKSRHNDSDLSPPRRSKNNDSDLSPARKSRHNDSDLSPPRKSRWNGSDLSPPKKSRWNDSDLSPPRKSRHNDSGDFSPPRRIKTSENSYKSRNKSYADQSKRDKGINEDDFGPPSKNRMYQHSDHNSSRRYSDYQSSYQQSKYRNLENDNDSRPSKQREHYKDNYKPESRYKYTEKTKSSKNYDSDSSPARKRYRETDRNPSPANKSQNYYKDSYEGSKKGRGMKMYANEDSRHYPDIDKRDKSSRYNYERKRVHSSRRDSPDRNDERMKKTLDGKTAGLQDAKALREETAAHKKREAEHFKKLSKEVSGVGKAAILRDSATGRKRDLEAEAEVEREKQKRQAELDAKYAKWGKGLKQVEDREEKLKDDLYEMSKPLARYADDVDLDSRLREQERDGDPMLEYIKQKQIKEGKRQPDRPKYQGSFMPNRFAIKPGHRWDGVDRSNGYEKQWFETKNAKIALQEDAYKWSTSDM